MKLLYLLNLVLKNKTNKNIRNKIQPLMLTLTSDLEI